LVQSLLEKEKGVFVAVSDNMKIVPDQIAPWVPGGLTTLGTDGFGRSDTRERLRPKPANCKSWQETSRGLLWRQR